jgi:Bacterial TSP3 repeat
MAFHRFVLSIVLGALLLCAGSQYAQAQPVDGRRGAVEDCENFVVGVLRLPVIGFLLEFDGFPDATWVRVAKRDTFNAPPFLEDRRFVSITGVVAEGLHIGDYPGDPRGDEAVINFKDFPDSHDSHDMNFYVRVDPTVDPLLANNGVLSTFGLDSLGRKPGDAGYAPDTIEVEWETGILTSRLFGDGVFFPKSMWPVPGDRVWVNGYWVFDCQHEQKNESTGEKGLRTEIHPPRAIAVMRNQVATPPAGGPPIPVTAVDLYIHGRAGIVVDLLECGGDVLFSSIQYPLPALRAPCPTRLGYTPRGSDSDDANYPDHDIALDHLGMPIADDFEFTVCTPKQPPGMSPEAEPIHWATEGPGPALIFETPAESASDGCANTDLYGPKQIRVKVQLGGSGLTADDVYARQIYIGWPAPPQPMRRLKVTLNSMRLGFDHDTGVLGLDDDCECSWFWMSVDRAPDEWRRLSDHADDPDDPDEVDGDEYLDNFSDGTARTFTGATWEFTMPAQPNLASFVIRAFGFDGGVGEDVTGLAFDQDCMDEHFAHHDIEEHVTLVPPFSFPDGCYLGVVLNGNDSSHGDNDPFDIIRREITAADISGFFGAWPSVGSVSTIARSSPRRCHVTYQLPLGIGEERVACLSADQARQAFEDRGFVVLDVDEYFEVEFNLTIESLPTDSDGDGITDPDEVSGGTNPLDADSDDDGLSDGEEETLGTDPNDSDSDDDGLSDGDEVHVHHTDPLDPDSDDDELPDGIEVDNGSDPLDSDSDNDGIIDGEDVEWLQNAIRALGPAAFTDSGGGLKAAMLTQLDAIEIDIANGRRRQAIQKLGRLRTNVNGCGAAADANDWIVDCVAQQEIRGLIDLLLANLG